MQANSIQDQEGIQRPAALEYMQHALQLAKLGAGAVAPNPMVGAVLVAKGRIIGQGYHRQYGKAHAEVDCIESVPAELKYLIPESDLFVTLEPCAHTGKTPPCTDRIIQERIPRVWIGSNDPFKLVNGQGIQKLEAASVKVHTQILKEDCDEVNRRFLCFHTKKRPYIILKWAQTADGYLEANEQTRLLISNSFSNRLVHKWRSEEAAILVGSQTAIMDDPKLTVRGWVGNQPLRIVADRQLSVSDNSNLYRGYPTLVYNVKENSIIGTAERIRLEPEKSFIEQMIQDLYNRTVQSILVEGGATMHRLFMEAGLWDEIRCITNTQLRVHAGIKAPELPVAEKKKEYYLGNDLHQIWRNKEFLKYT